MGCIESVTFLTQLLVSLARAGFKTVSFRSLLRVSPATGRYEMLRNVTVFRSRHDSPCQISSAPTASSTTPITSTRLSRLTFPVSFAP